MAQVYRPSRVFSRLFSITFFFTSLSLMQSHARAQSDVPRLNYENATSRLMIEVLSDTLVRFQYEPKTAGPTHAIAASPMIQKRAFSGAPLRQILGHGFSTTRVQVTVDPETLCARFFDLKANQVLTQLCSDGAHNLTLTQESMQNIYGLGEQFHNLGTVNGDWSGITRTPGNQFGNAIVGFGGGAVGNAQIPILYALGAGRLNYGFFLDETAALNWDFTSSLWHISKAAPALPNSFFRGYVIAGQDLPDLRSQYMDLVGHAPVPPKKAFGLWVSEFGYRNWNDMDAHLSTLREHHFPIDGFVLDLYWYGGYEHDSPNSNVGVYAFDQQNFPQAEKKVSDYSTNQGIGLMLIEESYVSKNKNFYGALDSKNFLVKHANAAGPTEVMSAWWGLGGMLDWTQDAAGSFWHDQMRKPLTDMGITFHWTDLGEPETYTNENYYAGTAKDDLDGGGGFEFHNLYNFKWLQSISDGYARNHEKLRHFILSRSGTAGIQRFGAAMWSGDIGSNLRSLASHLNAQTQMSLSGIDYFGADIGGFHREALEGDLNQLYTRWFAHASLLDVPVRPHTDNGSKQNHTAPDEIGDLKSNQFNIKQRYELAPYYYSLAHAAFESGAPLVPPLIYYFQNDPNVRLIADEKMIGPNLLMAASATADETTRAIYLPQGDWMEYHSGQIYHSAGQWFQNFPLYVGGLFQLPLFERAGAIIPKVVVDDRTMNILGQRTDGSHRDELNLEVYASRIPSQFTVTEDDGVTEAYKSGAMAKTKVSQTAADPARTVVQIASTVGTYDHAPQIRKFEVRLRGEPQKVRSVFVNGHKLAHLSRGDVMRSQKNGWFSSGKNEWTARVSRKSTELKEFAFSY